MQDFSMEPIRGKEGTVVTARNLSVADIPAMLRCEQNTWPPDWQASEPSMRARLDRFPEGFFGLFQGEDLVAMTSSMIKPDFHPHRLNGYGDSKCTWDVITGNGLIENHDPNGNSLYVVSVGVRKDKQGLGIGRGLINVQKLLAQRLGLDWVWLGARMPQFRDYLEAKYQVNLPKGDDLKFSQVAKELGIPYKQEVNEYAQLTRPEDGLRTDYELRFYDRGGLKHVKAKPDFGPDGESFGAGAIVAYKVFRNSR